jgi:nucleoside-diphosphate-sugar epimerase
MKNILITGGAGYIGAHVTELFIKKKKIFLLLIIFLQDLKNY